MEEISKEGAEESQIRMIIKGGNAFKQAVLE